MPYFIGITPPEELITKLRDFQQKWLHNELLEVVEPHITIKAQGGLTPDLNWTPQVEAVGASFSPFKVELRKPNFFAKDVLYLSVVAPHIHRLHKALVKAISPSEALIKRYMELDDYTPHLTLGQTHWGLSIDELREMEKLASKRWDQFGAFNVTSLRIYQEIKPNCYRPFQDLPLLNK